MIQNNHVAAKLEFEAKKTDSRLIPQSTGSDYKPKSFPDKALLHKHKSENIFVSDYTQNGEDYYFDVIPPPETHILGSHGKNQYSMLYVLEVTRQCGMILVHKVGKIPLKTPMILLGLKFNFDRPAYCSQHIRISHKPTKENLSDKKIKGEINFSIHDSIGIFGSSRISTLMANR